MASYENTVEGYKFNGTATVDFTDHKVIFDISYDDIDRDGPMLSISLRGDSSEAIQAVRHRLLPQLPNLLSQLGPPVQEAVVEEAPAPEKVAKPKKKKKAAPKLEAVETSGCDQSNEMRENSGVVPQEEAAPVKESASEDDEAAINYFTNGKKPVKQLKEVVSYFLDNGCSTVDEVTARIMAIKEDVPLLRKAQRVNERVQNIFVVLGLDV